MIADPISEVRKAKRGKDLEAAMNRVFAGKAEGNALTLRANLMTRLRELGLWPPK